MKTAGWERWAPLGGIVFVLLTIPTLFLPAKAPPSAGDPAAQWAAFVQDHRSAYLVSMCLSGLAVVAFLVFLASLASRLRAADQELLALVALGGGLVTAAVWYVWLSFEGVLAWTSPSGIDPAVVKTLLAAADFHSPSRSPRWRLRPPSERCGRRSGRHGCRTSDSQAQFGSWSEEWPWRETDSLRRPVVPV